MSLTAAALRDAVLAGRADPRQAVRDAFDRARGLQAGREGLNLVLWSDQPRAEHEAAALEARRSDRAPGALLGVPVAVKDNIATLALPTTCGSRILEGYVSPFEATAVTKLRQAGAVVVAKTNMDEFGMGSSTEFSAWGPARNPVAPHTVPGGSSGGSAGVVAAGITRIALGSETGGSVRQPAAFCGIVGVKPTYGRVSRFGLVAFASSLDQVGVFGGTVDDAALALQVIAGPDANDATSAGVAVHDYRASAHETLTGVRVGIPRECFPESLDAGVRMLCDRAIDQLRMLGADVVAVSLPRTELAVPAYCVIAPAEASANLARFDGTRYGLRLAGDGLRGMYEATRAGGFGPEVTRRIMLGTWVLSAGHRDAYYGKAQQVRALIAADVASVFASGVDLLFTPTTPTPAFEPGTRLDPYDTYLGDVFTVTANLVGIPAMSLPIGRLAGLPVGGQLMAPHFGERRMLAAAYALERALGREAHR